MGLPSTESNKLESCVDVESPCTGICQVDFFDVCKGCGRTLEEISEWPFLSSSERKQIVDRLF